MEGTEEIVAESDCPKKHKKSSVVAKGASEAWGQASVSHVHISKVTQEGQLL